MDRLPIDVAGSCRAWEVVDVFLEEFKAREVAKKQSNLAASRRQRTSKYTGASRNSQDSYYGDSPDKAFSINAESEA